MIIVGCDYHPSFQQIAFVDTATGELKEQRLAHREAAEEFYPALAARGQQVRVGCAPQKCRNTIEKAGIMGPRTVLLSTSLLMSQLP